MEKRDEKRKGLFIVIDGLDGIGKGEVERSLIQYEQRNGKAVFDTVSFCRANRKGLPELTDFWNPPEVYYDTVVTAEPTYAGIGHNIRFEMITRNGRDYSAEAQIEAYALDRLVQMKRVVLPALENGLNVIQSRCCAASLVYQPQVAETEGKSQNKIREHILKQEGNAFQLDHAPDLLIIPVIGNMDQLMERLRERESTKKDDNAIFENAAFQGKLSPMYQSEWLREIFEEKGTRVEYLDAGKSERDTRQQAISIYKKFIEGLRQKS